MSVDLISSLTLLLPYLSLSYQSISSCALFLAAKVEEQPRKLEHVIKVSHMCLHRETPPIDVKSEVKLITLTLLTCNTADRIRFLVLDLSRTGG